MDARKLCTSRLRHEKSEIFGPQVWPLTPSGVLGSSCCIFCTSLRRARAVAANFKANIAGLRTWQVKEGRWRVDEEFRSQIPPLRTKAAAAAAAAATKAAAKAAAKPGH